MQGSAQHCPSEQREGRAGQGRIPAPLPCVPEMDPVSGMRLLKLLGEGVIEPQGLGGLWSLSPSLGCFGGSTRRSAEGVPGGPGQA